MTQELREEARRREEEREAAGRRRARLARDIRSVAESPEGRRVLRWLIGQGDIFAEDYQPGPFGAYRAGLRASSLRLWRQLRRHLSRETFIGIAFDAGEAEEDFRQTP